MSEATRALRPRNEGAQVTRSICPYCAVGCGQLVFHRDNQLGKQFVAGGAFRTQMTRRNRRIGIAFDRDQGRASASDPRVPLDLPPG
jgi:anaerobic selenocysteine-containing dehydrogenase